MLATVTTFQTPERVFRQLRNVHELALTSSPLHQNHQLTLFGCISLSIFIVHSLYSLQGLLSLLESEVEIKCRKCDEAIVKVSYSLLILYKCWLILFILSAKSTYCVSYYDLPV